MKKKHILPPELTGKYKKPLPPRIQENQHKLSFALYRDKGKNRSPVSIGDYEFLAPVSTPGPLVPDVEKETRIEYETECGQLLAFFPRVITDKADVAHSLDGFIYKGSGHANSDGVDLQIHIFTLFSGSEYLTIKVNKSLRERMQSAYFVPMTREERIASYMNGDTPPTPALPIAQIAPIANKPAINCTVHIGCGGHWTEY